MGIIREYILNIAFCSIIGASLAGIYCFFIYKKTKKNRGFFSIIIFVAYLFALLSVTVFPRMEVGILSDTGRPYVDFYFNADTKSTINLIPFNSILTYIKDLFSASADAKVVSRINLAGNIILFIPMGVFLHLWFRGIKNFWKIVLSSIVFSTLIEIIQFVIGRSSDIDDLILNLFGTLIGFLLSCAFMKKSQKDIV